MPARLRKEQFDGPWKEALRHYFHAALELYFPTMAAQVDPAEAPQFLDKELERLLRGSRAGRGTVDLLARVKLRDGQEFCVLLHVEVQAQRDPRLPERMWRYLYRIWEREQLPVAGLVILADPELGWRPEPFGWEIGGVRLQYSYLTAKLLDLEPGRDELERSNNPMGMVTLAHLDALATHSDPAARGQRKRALVRNLYQRGWTSEAVEELFSIIDWLVTLPEPEQLAFEDWVDELEEETEVIHVNKWRREGLQAGRQEGRQEMSRTLLLNALRERLGTVPETVEIRVRQADADWCGALLPRIYRGEAVPELGLTEQA